MVPSPGCDECPRKMVQALSIIINNQLKQNHDDTLVEQLMTLLQGTLENSPSNLRSLSDYLKNLPLTPSIHPCILRVLAFVICNCDEECSHHLNLYLSFADTVNEDSSLQWQACLLDSIDYLLSSSQSRSSNLQLLLRFFKVACKLLTCSSSYIIKRQAEKVIQNYLALLKDGNNSTDLSSICDSLFEKIDSSSLDFYLASIDTMPAPIVTKLNQCIKDQCDEIASGKPADETFLSSLASLCGYTCKDRQDLLVQITFWLKRSDIKAVITLVSWFEKKHPGESGDLRFVWMLYPIIAHFGIASELDKEKTFFQAQFDQHWIEQRTNAKVCLFCLNLAKQTLKSIGDDDIHFIFKLLKCILVKLMTKKTTPAIEKKVSLSIFDLILQLSECNDNLSTDSCSIARDLSTLLVSNGYLLAEYLFFLKQLVTKSIHMKNHPLCYLQIVSKILSMDKFHQPLRTWQDELENHFSSLSFIEIMDEENLSQLELLHQCVCHITIHYYPLDRDDDCHQNERKSIINNLIGNFNNLWNQHKTSSSFISTVLPLFITFNYFLSRPEKQLIDFVDDDDKMLAQFVEFFHSHNLIDSLVDTLIIITQSHALQHLYSWSHSSYQTFVSNLIPQLIQVCTNATYDDELKVKSLVVVNELLTQLKSLSFLHKFILMYTSNLLDCLFIFITGPYDGTNIRRVAHKFSLEITASMNEITLEMLQNENIMNETGKLCMKHDETNDHMNQPTCQYTHEDKKSIIDEMFKDYDAIPTQDILHELSTRDDHTHSAFEGENRSNSGQTMEQLYHFFSSFDPSSVFCEPMNQPPPGILDDIINARSNTNSTIPDCY